MIRRPPRSTLSSSSAASDVYKRQEVTKDYMEMTKEEVFKDYGSVFSSVKSTPRIKTRRPSKKLKQCSKCGRVGDEKTKHSLTGEHKPPFIWLCRQPCCLLYT